MVPKIERMGESQFDLLMSLDKVAIWQRNVNACAIDAALSSDWDAMPILSIGGTECR